MSNTAALTVVEASDGTTHLVASSPAIPGQHPGLSRCLCGTIKHNESFAHISAVDCGECLLGSSRYWGLPGWKVEVAVP